jgi:hypothetical protein
MWLRGGVVIDRRTLLIGAGAGLTLAGCGSSSKTGAAIPPLPATPRAARLIAAARLQVGATVSYDAAYTRIAFPNGDVPRDRGACTDVLIRAYRHALALDLQALINSDMRAAFAAYARTWGLTVPDSNIDHRRVPNLAIWLERREAALPVPSAPSSWQPGDIFTSLVAGTGTHVGLVSDREGARSPPRHSQYRRRRSRGGCPAPVADYRPFPLGRRLTALNPRPTPLVAPMRAVAGP